MSGITDALANMGEDPSGESMSVEAVSLLAACVEQNARDAAWVTNQLVDGYKEDYERVTAELAAVRIGITNLLDGPYMPTSHALIGSLFPSEQQIDYYRR